MYLTSIKVTNLRSIRDASLELTTVTPLIGPNGSGKSTWLLALRWFYDGVPQGLDASDFFGGDWYGKTIEVSVTFADLAAQFCEADARMVPYVRDAALTVTMRASGPASADEPKRSPVRYFGTLLQHKPFATIRRDAGGSSAKTAAALALKAGNPRL